MRRQTPTTIRLFGSNGYNFMPGGVGAALRCHRCRARAVAAAELARALLGHCVGTIIHRLRLPRAGSGALLPGATCHELWAALRGSCEPCAA